MRVRSGRPGRHCGPLGLFNAKKRRATGFQPITRRSVNNNRNTLLTYYAAGYCQWYFDGYSDRHSVRPNKY
jgi:hypothetical protein